jgi:hypothetical protein
MGFGSDTSAMHAPNGWAIDSQLKSGHDLADSINGEEFTFSFRNKFDAWRLGSHLEYTVSIKGVSVTTPREFFEAFVPRSLRSVSETLPDGVVVAFHIDGPEGGSWQVEQDEEGSRVTPTGEGPKDCEIRCNTDTFMRIIRGSLGSNRAFLSGRLTISGDVGLALALEQFLREAA